MADEPLPRPAKEGLDALMAKFRASIPRVAARGRDHEKDLARLREIETALRNQYHTYFSSIGAFQHLLSVDTETADSMRAKAHTALDVTFDLLQEMDGITRKYR